MPCWLISLRLVLHIVLARHGRRAVLWLLRLMLWLRRRRGGSKVAGLIGIIAAGTI